MLSAFKNIFKIKDLRNKVFYTLFIIFLVRLLQNVPLPGINLGKLGELMEHIKEKGADNAGTNAFAMVNMFSGGALQKASIGVLGIMPYITASIIMQLMTPVFPQLEKLQREGAHGRQKINQYTRYMTIIICIVQGAAAVKLLPQLANSVANGKYNFVTDMSTSFVVTSTLMITATCLLIMWLGEQITEKGLGNGASLIITVSVISSMPQAFMTLVNDDTLNLANYVIKGALFIGVTAATVALVEATRKIPIKYARKSYGSKVVSEKTSFLPLKVNHAGVMPIIFAGALTTFPTMILSNFVDGRPWLATVIGSISYGSIGYIVFSAILILIFTFFWVATQFNPVQIADDLNRSGGFIPGYRPGESTANFLNRTMTRITVAGAIFLVALAILPLILSGANQSDMLVNQFFGGTTLLIMVGVVLQTMQQVEVQLMQHNYDGFVQGGKLRSRKG